MWKYFKSESKNKKKCQKIKCILIIIVYVLKELIEYSLLHKNYNWDLEIEFILLRDALSSLAVGAVLQSKPRRSYYFIKFPTT